MRANRKTVYFSRSELPSLRLGLPSSVSTWRGKRPRADSSKATLKKRDEEILRLNGELTPQRLA
jgi:hypothetical protein